MKQINKETKHIGKSKVLTFVTLTLIVGFLIAVSILIMNQSGFSVTTYLGEKENTLIQEISTTFTKIITGETNPTGNALFDIKLTISEKYKLINSGQNISIIVDLTNFGEAGKTNVAISYIITNSKGDIVMIEHEKKVVETQMSYLKTLDLPYLESGNYKIFIEILYSNASATANGEFNVI